MVLGRLSEAVEVARSAVQEIGEDPLLVRALGVSLVSDGHYEEGLEPLRSLAESQGDEAAGGTSGGRSGSPAEPVKLSSASTRLCRRDGEYVALGSGCTSLGDGRSFDQSSTASAQWVERADTDADAWGALGWALAHAQGADLSASERAFDRGWALQADVTRSLVPEEPGEVRLVQGQRDAARADLELALALAERSVSNRPWLASTRRAGRSRHGCAHLSRGPCPG